MCKYVIIQFGMSAAFIIKKYCNKIVCTILSVFIINLFINSDAILNRDALWSIQGKNHHVNAAIVGGIRRTGKVLR